MRNTKKKKIQGEVRNARNHTPKLLWAPIIVSHNFILRVCFSPAPECVDRVCWDRFLSTSHPPHGPRNTVVAVIFCFIPSTYSFLIKAGILETDFHYTTIFLIFATYSFSHNFMLRVSFYPARDCRPCLLEPLFFDPSAGPGTPS